MWKNETFDLLNVSGSEAITYSRSENISNLIYFVFVDCLNDGFLKLKGSAWDTIVLGLGKGTKQGFFICLKKIKAISIAARLLNK